MIKKRPSSNNLNNKIFKYVDSSINSMDYFRVSLPERFKIGKNTFTINPTNQLVKDSQIWIDLYDSNNQPLYFEVLPIVDEQLNRIISVYIYPDTPFGNISLYIAGVKNDGLSDKRSPANIVWANYINLEFSETTDRPLYTYTPEITMREISHPIYTQTTRLSDTSGSFDIVVGELNQQVSKYDIVDLKYKNVYVPSNPINDGVIVRSEKINQNQYSIVNAAQPFFSSSMVGGQLFFDTFTASIVATPSTKIAYINPRFTGSIIPNPSPKITYTSSKFTESIKTNNWYVRYFQKTTSSFTKTENHQSYINFKFRNLSPETGHVKKVNIKYKPVSYIGEYIDLSDLNVTSNNLLVDESIVDFDGYFNIGSPKTLDQTYQYWSSSDYGGFWDSGFVNRNGNEDIITIALTPITTTTGYVKVETTNLFDFISNEDTNYVIKFDHKLDVKHDNNSQIDIYVSGSSIQVDEPFPRVNLSPLNDLNLGTYIGSVNGNINNSGQTSIVFKTIEKDQQCKVYFIIRSGKWVLKNIKIQPETIIGFTQNDWSAIIPIKDLLSNTEYSFKINYLSANNTPSNVESLIQGCIISGSNYMSTFSGSFYGDGSNITNIQFAETASYAMLPTNLFGSTTGTTSDSGIIEIVHNYGSIPTMFLITNSIVGSGIPTICNVTEKNTHSCTIKVWQYDGDVYGSQEITIDWLIQ